MSPCDGLANLLRTLHDRGIYKSLHLKIFHHTELINDLPTFNGLEGLEVDIDLEVALPPLIHLKKIELWHIQNIDMESLAKQSIELEHLFFFNFDFDVISQFFKHSKMLSTVKLCRFGHDGSDLDLCALNTMRKNLGAKLKVTIYLYESIYLEEKGQQKICT